MTPISNEKRELLIEAKKRGETEAAIAKWLNISTSSVSVIWKLYRETGSYQPTPYPGRKPILEAEKLEEIKRFVTENPDKTLDEIIRLLAKIKVGAFFLRPTINANHGLKLGCS